MVFVESVFEKKPTKAKCQGLERQVGDMTNYPVGDFLIRIKNAAMARRHDVTFPRNKLLLEVAKVLEKEGYVSKISQKDDTFSLRLVYKHKKPVLMDIKLVSRPGLRIYMNVDEIIEIKRKGISTLIISTPKGLMSAQDAIKKRLGGEIIAKVW